MQLSTDSKFRRRREKNGSVAEAEAEAAAATAVQIGLHPNLQTLVVTREAGGGVDGPITK